MQFVTVVVVVVVFGIGCSPYTHSLFAWSMFELKTKILLFIMNKVSILSSHAGPSPPSRGLSETRGTNISRQPGR
jgi:hypothetical protein